MMQWLQRALNPKEPGDTPASESSELVARYKQLPEAGLEQNNALIEELTKADFDEGGKDLGILKKNILVLDSEDEMAVLADYCLHDVRRDGLNAIERVLRGSPPPAGSDERELLEAKQRAYFSLFVVEATEPGVGIHVRDLLREELLFLVDIGLSVSAHPGVVMAIRVFAPAGIFMTTGAALPIGELSPGQIDELAYGIRGDFNYEDYRNLAPEEARALTASIIRTSLERGAAQRIAYLDPGEMSRPAHALLSSPAPRHDRRKLLCPCGSGKKYRQCCGKRG
jgi:hypothetical protein